MVITQTTPTTTTTTTAPLPPGLMSPLPSTPAPRTLMPATKRAAATAAAATTTTPPHLGGPLAAPAPVAPARVRGAVGTRRRHRREATAGEEEQACAREQWDAGHQQVVGAPTQARDGVLAELLARRRGAPVRGAVLEAVGPALVAARG